MENVGFLIELLNSVDGLLFVFFRVLGFIIILPVLSSINIPTILRMGFSFVLAFLIFLTGLGGFAAEISMDMRLLSLVAIAISEFLFGFAMAYMVYAIFATLLLAGLFIDDAVGFNIVSVVDPMSQVQVPVAGNLLYLMAMVMLIITGGLNLLFATFVRSFELVPIGSAYIITNPYLWIYLVSVVTDMLLMGLQFAMPLVAVGLLVNVSLGILVKSVPQMNMFVIGIPLRLVIGVVMFFLILPAYLGVYNRLFEILMDTVINIIELARV